MIFSETNTKIAPALVKAWGELENPKHNTSVSVKMKSGGSYKFDYTDLNGIFNEARRVFKDNGISVIQNSSTEVLEGARVASVETMLLHTSGEYLKSPKLQFNAAGSMQDFGGQLTYMKRYSLSAMLGIATEKDDDANGASGNETTFKDKPTTTSQAPSDAQRGMMRAKTNAIAKRDGLTAGAVYEAAQKATGIQKPSEQINKNDASKIIEYLITQEG